jgi:hypothetical protein
MMYCCAIMLSVTMVNVVSPQKRLEKSFFEGNATKKKNAFQKRKEYYSVNVFNDVFEFFHSFNKQY